MINNNIFKEKGLIGYIPFLTAIYVSFVNESLNLVALFLGLNIILYYLIVMFFAKKSQSKNPRNEKDVYKELISKQYYKYSAIASIMHGLLIIISIILLYSYLNNIIAYSLFWLLVAGFVFNILRMFIIHFDIIKLAFTGKL
ncbi:MAG: hypothetical protein ACOCRX_06995 [Candidatus Woesearchaeota archaeon]